MKATAIRPAVIKVRGNPRRPPGALAYFSFSLIAAKMIIARAHEEPEPKAYTTDSVKVYSRCTMNDTPAKITQFTVIRGRKIPRAAYSEGTYLSRKISRI